MNKIYKAMTQVTGHQTTTDNDRSKYESLGISIRCLSLFTNKHVQNKRTFFNLKQMSNCGLRKFRSLVSNILNATERKTLLKSIPN